MSNDKLAKTIDDAFEGRDTIGPKTKGAVRKAVARRSTCSTAGRRASPNGRPAATGTSISG